MPRAKRDTELAKRYNALCSAAIPCGHMLGSPSRKNAERARLICGTCLSLSDCRHGQRYLMYNAPDISLIPIKAAPAIEPPVKVLYKEIRWGKADKISYGIKRAWANKRTEWVAGIRASWDADRRKRSSDYMLAHPERMQAMVEGHKRYLEDPARRKKADEKIKRTWASEELRAEVSAKAKARWAALPPEKKEEIARKRAEAWGAFPPEKLEAIKRKRIETRRRNREEALRNAITNG